MKTVKYLLTGLAVTIVAIASAVEKPKMNITTLSADKAVVTIENNNATYLELSIVADNGELVYYKKSAQPVSNYKKVFDFTNLKNGSYTMDLNVNGTRLSKDFDVSYSSIQFSDSKLRFDPHFNFSEDVLKLSYLNFDQEKIYLSIYKEGVLVYESKLGREFNISSGYDLSKLEEGDYDVVLSSLNNEFSYAITK